ncbi:MAG: tRNA (adenosine(37)-N6)-threonylcarbamoyltransferase complex dimerization subunit type 1 TsaB [Candidatus Cryptobacteroides sp.]
MEQQKCVDILLLETSASLCSVALARDGKTIASRESSEPRAHANLTAPFVKEVLADAGISLQDCSAVCLSSGPGSYTGLRVGCSTAKGLCFGAGLPLMSLCTLDILAHTALQQEQHFDYIVPMLDARRMEVYTAVYDGSGKRLSEIEAKVIDAGSYAELLEKGTVLFIGDGALKCKEVLQQANATFMECQPLARNMAELALELYRSGKFEDIAYFEPFYLKDFIATVSKKNVLGL